MARRRADTDAGPAFELHRFAVTAAAADAVLVELEGRWPGGSPPAGRSRLLAGEDDEQRALAPAAEAVAGRTWRATYAVPASLAGLPLAVAAGGYVVELPAPDPPGPEDERIARLAREGNQLRRRLDVAEEAASHAEALGRERDELRSDLDAAAAEAERLQAEAATERDTLRARVGELEAELDTTRQEADARVGAERERLEAHLAAVVAEHGDERRRLESRLVEVDRDRQAEREELQAVHAAELARLAEEYDAELERRGQRPPGPGPSEGDAAADDDEAQAEGAGDRDRDRTTDRGPAARRSRARAADGSSAPTTAGPESEATTTYGPAADAPTTIGPAAAPGEDDDVPTIVAGRPRWAAADNGATAASRPASHDADDDDVLGDADDDDLDPYEDEPITPPAYRGAPRSARGRAAGARAAGGSGSPRRSGEAGRWIAVVLLLVGLVLVGFIVTGLLR